MTPDTAALRALADALDDGLQRRPWTWTAGKNGGYPQRVISVGNVLLIAETYDEPDSGATTAPYIAALDPATVRALCDAADEVERLRAAVVERDTRLAETIRYHDARVNRADEATDASRTAHAALVAELRALCDDSDHGWVHRRAVLARLDRHAPTTGETP